MSGAFLDSNIVVYAFSDDIRAERARLLLRAAAGIGIQTLNEFTNVSLRKFGRDWARVRADLGLLRQKFPDPVPLGLRVHEEGLRLAERYRFSWWDATMVAAALQTDCDLFWSEDLHDGLLVDGRLRIANPFA